MTLEERQLLLRDISARLPYGVYVHFCNTNIDEKLTEISLGETINQIRHNGKGNQGLIKPYLRPMSSMTDEEREEESDLWNEHDTNLIRGMLGFYCSHHLDWNNLIPMGLALKAPEGMYKDN